MADEERYFPGQFPELRRRLDRYLAGLGGRLAKSSFSRDVAFLLLAGGYGRGEGGVFESENAPPALYNDLEFYLVLKSPVSNPAAQRWCDEESHSGEHETGIEVEFKILPLRALTDAQPSMFYYDLLAAHRLVYGDARFVAALPARLRDGSKIPAHEATRLLFNRGSGLFYASFQLSEAAESVDKSFVERNHAKAKLAFADAVLTLNGRYTWSCKTRHQRLSEALAQVPPNFNQLVEWHQSAVDFKFHPRHGSPPLKELIERQQALVSAWTELFLWLESIRLRNPFPSPAGYAAYRGRLFPEFPIHKNLALHLRDRLRRGKPPRGCYDYPRASLQRALALLLAAPGADTLPELRRLLSLPQDAPLRQIHDTYRYWWRFYN